MDAPKLPPEPRWRRHTSVKRIVEMAQQALDHLTNKRDGRYLLRQGALIRPIDTTSLATLIIVSQRLEDEYNELVSEHNTLWKEKYEELAEAVRNLYCAALWSPDRRCAEKRLWIDVRDAAGIDPKEGPEKRANVNDDQEKSSNRKRGK